MPDTSVDNPTMSAWTYALSVDITAPPVTYKYPPTTSATGSSANISGRRHDFLGAGVLAATGLPRGSLDGRTSGLRFSGFSVFPSADAGRSFPVDRLRSRR